MAANPRRVWQQTYKNVDFTELENSSSKINWVSPDSSIHSPNQKQPRFGHLLPHDAAQHTHTHTHTHADEGCVFMCKLKWATEYLFISLIQNVHTYSMGTLHTQTHTHTEPCKRLHPVCGVEEVWGVFSSVELLTGKGQWFWGAVPHWHTLLCFPEGGGGTGEEVLACYPG